MKPLAAVSEFQFPTCHFPPPQLTKMTIARSTSHSGYAPTMRVPTMKRSTSTGKNPMMCVTLPKEFGDDPLASPIGPLPYPAFSSEPVPQPELPEHEPAPVQASSSSSSPSGFANVFTRRRQSSIEKKPPMAPSAPPPMLRRTTSAPIKQKSLLGKMKPMLKRVVSGTKSHSEAMNDDDDHYDDSRESLLMLMRVPDIQRNSHIPLMMAGDLDY